jgi:DNA polymerase-3 subunit alpha
MYIPLRNHTSYSLCSGAIKIDALIDFAKTQQFPALGICDSQNLFGALEFSLACKKEGIQPIIGCELLVDFHCLELNNNNHLDFEKSLAITPLFAFNQQGYENLMNLVSSSFLYQKSTSPFIEIELLKKHSEGLIALSGGLGGILAKLLLNNQKQLAICIAVELLKIFPNDNFYLEITRHQHKDEQKIEADLIQLAIDYNIPLVATNNAFFLTQNMYEAQDILSCIASGSTLEEEGRAKNTPWQYLRNIQEFCQTFCRHARSH